MKKKGAKPKDAKKRRRSSLALRKAKYLTETGGSRGTVERGYESVREVFSRLYAEGRETGSQCCCFLGGRPVVSLVGGVFSRPEDRAKDFGSKARLGTPLLESDLIIWFSNSKSVCSIAMAMAEDRGMLNLGDPISKYWPESKVGQEGFTVTELLQHRAHVPFLSKRLALESMTMKGPPFQERETSNERDDHLMKPAAMYTLS